MKVRHVLFDADGVLQHLPGGWYAAMEPYVGDRAREFLHETWSDERPMLAGRGDYLPVLAAKLAAYGVTAPVRDVYEDVWKRIAPVEETLALVHRLRSGGFGVHLATNQEQHRGRHMRQTLGYDDLFDVSCYSFELGVAKPDPRFFIEAAHLIGAEPAEIVFVDDSLVNVDGARSVGLAGLHWSFERGQKLLLSGLAAHGVRPA